MRRHLTVLTAAALSLSSCALMRDPNVSFHEGQTWQVTGQDGSSPLSIQVSTGAFNEYDTQVEPGLPNPLPWNRATTRMNTHPLGLLGLMMPGATPVIARDTRSGETAIIWNAGTAGRTYRCLIRDNGPARTVLTGDLTRLEQNADVPLGQCEARRVK